MAAKKTLDQFKLELAEVSDNKITVAPDAEYIGAHTHIDVVCGVCDHSFSASPNNLTSLGHSCPSCSAQKKRDSWGKIRQPRASEAVKQKARDMRASGMTIRAIADELGRSKYSISSWCNPEQLEKARKRNAAYRAANREAHRASNLRYKQQTTHGRAKSQIDRAMRRGEYREYDEAGNLIYQEWEVYTAEDTAAFEQIEHRIAYLNKVNKNGVKWSLEHLLPLTCGGRHIPQNIAIRPLLENISKGNRIDPDHMALRCHKISKLFNY